MQVSFHVTVCIELAQCVLGDSPSIWLYEQNLSILAINHVWSLFLKL